MVLCRGRGRLCCRELDPSCVVALGGRLRLGVERVELLLRGGDLRLYRVGRRRRSGDADDDGAESDTCNGGAGDKPDESVIC